MVTDGVNEHFFAELYVSKARRNKDTKIFWLFLPPARCHFCGYRESCGQALKA